MEPPDQQLLAAGKGAALQRYSGLANSEPCRAAADNPRLHRPDAAGHHSEYRGCARADE